MSKTNLTLEIEKKLKEKYKKTGERYAFEVPFKDGICDFVTAKTNTSNNKLPFIICYQIKVSFSDLKSENGHNFFGDENYYVIPEELLEEIILKKENWRFEGKGIIIYKNERFYKKTNGINYKSTLKIEDKFKVLDMMLMRTLNS